MEKKEFDVFISYSRRDYVDEKTGEVIPGNIVSKVRECLTEAGISYWFDEDGIYSGDNFIDKIVTNIEASKVFLYISTANANVSKWTCKEIASADEFGKPIIPFRIDETPYNKKVMFRISDLDYVEYYSNPEKGLARMVASVQEQLNRLAEKEKQRKAEEERRREEQERQKAEAEFRRKEETDEIRRRCEKLNIEENKIELSRKELLLSAERLDDKELISLITTSSPLRKKYEKEFGDAAKAELLETKNLLEKNSQNLQSVKVQLKNLQDENKRLQEELDSAKQSGNEEELIASPSNRKLHWIYGGVILVLVVQMIFLLNHGGDRDMLKTVDVEGVEIAPKALRDFTYANNSLGTFEYFGEYIIENGVMIPNGNGKATFSNGDTFEGKFENGDLVEGTYTWAYNGSFFRGTFKQNEPDKGRYFSKFGNEIE